MEKTERLLDLIALFLDAREPISWAELREAFPEEYDKGSVQACERKFERDKAELAELGIALEYRPGSDESKEGYQLSREEYYLPKLGLTPEEVAVLYAAGSAAHASGAFPGRADLGHALRKIAFASPVEPESGAQPVFVEHARGRPDVAEHLEVLWQALLSRKRVTLNYRGLGREEETTRAVDPWGICLRGGTWVVVGYCHLRKARRTFHVDRIAEVAVNREKPRTPDYEVPEDFGIEQVAAEQVWEYRFHEPVEVRLRLSAALSPLAPHLFPRAVADSGEWIVRATYLEGLLRRVLSLGEGVQVAGPAQAVERRTKMLEALIAGHQLAREQVA